MAGRVWRWTFYGLGLGLLPLLLAFVVRAYYLERPPTLAESLGAGDATLVVVTWSAGALLDLSTARDAPERLRLFLAFLAITLLLVGAVAYACLTSDSATGRVQTAAQRRYMAVGSVVGLLFAAPVAALATGFANRQEVAAA